MSQRWQDLAECKSMDPNFFFDYFESSPGVQKEILKTCQRCVVQQQCLDYAIDNNLKGGVFGGQYIKVTKKRKKKVKGKDSDKKKEKRKKVYR